MHKGLSRFLLSCFTVALVSAGCGGGGGGGVSELPTGPGSGSPHAASPQSASITARLRVPANVPGARQVAFEPVSWLAWFARPAHAAGEVYTLPGARVDALGMTWAMADQEGVARFRSLPPQHYRFVVSTELAGVVFQTLQSAAPGATIDLDITELTTAATFVALRAVPSSDGGGADMESLVAAFGGGEIASFNALLARLQERMASGENWLDENFSPQSADLQELIAQANQSANFIALQFPVPGQSGVSTGPLLLGVSFNGPVDPTTLAPVSGGQWSLQGDFGSINAANLSSYGSVAYTDQAIDLDGRAIPAHTLYFRLPNLTLPQGELSELTLSLGSLPEDALGRPFLCARPPSKFVSWSFVPGGPENPGASVGSNVAVDLDWLATDCQGSSSADLSPIPAPVSAQGTTAPDRFRLDYYQHAVPFVVPGKDRVLLVSLRDADTIQLGDTYHPRTTPEGVGYSLIYQERSYTDPNGGPTSELEWSASEGVLTVVDLEGGRIALELDATMRRHDGQDSFCLQTTIDTEFP